MCPRPKSFFYNKWDDEKLDFSRPTFNQAFREYIDKCYLEHLAEVTIKEKDSLFKLLKEYKISWGNINCKDILGFQTALLKKYSRKYTAKFIVHLKAFFRYCVKKDYLPVNEFNRLDFLKAPKQKKKSCIIATEHIHTILQHCVSSHTAAAATTTLAFSAMTADLITDGHSGCWSNL